MYLLLNTVSGSLPPACVYLVRLCVRPHGNTAKSCACDLTQVLLCDCAAPHMQ